MVSGLIPTKPIYTYKEVCWLCDNGKLKHALQCIEELLEQHGYFNDTMRKVWVKGSEELPPNTILVGVETELDTAPGGE